MPDNTPSSPRPWPFWYVSGGCRSGKSAFAQRQAERCAPERLYIATCYSDNADPEMAERIRLHRQSRGRGWRVHEATAHTLPHLAEHLPALARPGEALLLDCLSLWAASRMNGADNAGTPPDFADACAELMRVLRELPCPVFVVGSEVGLGLVPQSREARRFRDMNGLAGQLAAAEAGTVVFMVSGLPMTLKGSMDL